MAEQALSGVKVIDLTQHVSGPACTKLLADYGADVIKIERPVTGDITRRMAPFLNDEPHPEKSGLFLHFNTNKKSLTLNLKAEAGKKIFRQLVEEANIVVESFRPGVMARLGLDYDALSAINPELVMTSISNFGQTGPYRDFKASELIIYGMGGAMYACGIPEKEPQKYAGTFVLFMAGLSAASATLAGYMVSDFQSEGQYIDYAIIEGIASGVDRIGQHITAYAFNQEIQGRSAATQSGPPGMGPHPCKDGYVELVIMLPMYMERTRNLLGRPEFLEDPKWEAPGIGSKPELREEFEAFYLGWLADKTRDEVMVLTQKHGILGAPLNTMEDVFNDPHLNSRGTFKEIDHPVTGPLKYLSRAFNMSETPWQLRSPAPLLGQHNQEILGQLGYTKEEIVQLKKTGVI